MHYGGASLAIAFNSNGISPSSPEAKERFITGLTYLTQYGRYNESLEYFDAALSLDRNFSEAWVAKGVALHNRGRYDEALACYDKAREISPGDAGIWNLKGVTLRDYGKGVESAECFRRAAELDPRYGTG
jgi:tetratricopeptide (TPR) repeat protein